tara:strand:+ start:4100 stop:4696 length:597 start_codon:yes stop_codon:yes gene_type:complete
MNDVLKLIFVLLTVIGILILFSYNYELKKFISKIKLRNYVKLSKKDEFNLYTFLETKYENILLPKEIIFIENKDYFICNSLKIMSNNQIVNLKIRFKPLKDKDFITKYSFFDKYGIFEILENEDNNSEVPEINHLSSDNSDDLNFDINEIINSDIEELPNENIYNKDKDISNQEIFLKNIDDNDTENETTETMINNIL